MNKAHSNSCLVFFISVVLGMISFAKSVYWTISPDGVAMQAYHWFLVLIVCSAVASAAFIAAVATRPVD